MDIEQQRNVSHDLFGNRYALEVAASISRNPKELFTQKDVVGDTSLDKGLVQVVFAKFKKALIIEELRKEGTSVPCKRVESAIWNAFDLFQAELDRA